MRSRPRLLLPAAMSVLVLAALAFAILASKGSGSGSHRTAAQSGPAPAGTVLAPSAGSQFDGAALPSGVAAPAFTLRRIGGGELSLTALRGKPLVLTFLYSRCGAPCVLIAQQLRGALDDLGAASPHVLVVSADPRGDDAARVSAFLSQVGLAGRVDWLTGTLAQLQAVWRAYRVPPAAAGAATFGRYATVLLVDARGQERVVYGSEQLTPEALVHDLRRLSAAAGGS